MDSNATFRNLVTELSIDESGNDLSIGTTNIPQTQVIVSELIGSQVPVHIYPLAKPILTSGRHRTSGRMRAGDRILNVSTSCTAAFGSISALLLAFGVFGAGCGFSSDAADVSKGPSPGKSQKPLGGKTSILMWGVSSESPPRTITIGGGVDHCVGRPEPRIKPPHIVYRGERVFITLRVEMPPIRNGSACASVELFVGREVTLRRDLSDVKIFDAGVSPPKLRWPQ
ncbi:MAG: hypothetical protein WD810_01570 [Solirubrobacterales bacterium]